MRRWRPAAWRLHVEVAKSEPAFGPVEFELTSVQITGTTLSGTVVVKNLHNRRFPRITRKYDYQQLPSLSRDRIRVPGAADRRALGRWQSRNR